MVRSETQPAPSAPTTAKTRLSIPAVTVTAPGTSYPPDVSSRGLFGISLSANSSTISATGPGIRKVQRQPTSVSRPPRIRPSEKPLAAQVVKILSARFRSGPSWKVVVRMESAAGAVNAAAMPFTNRAAMSSSGLVASELSIETTAKTASAIRKTRRRPSRSAVRPPSSRKPPYPRT